MPNRPEPLSVVVVEDSAAFVLRLKLVLNQLPGVKIAGISESASDAIALIEQTQPDLVLLDLYLIQSSGMDVLRHIRDAGLKTRTLIMTSEQSCDVRSACLSLGAYGVFDKAGLVQHLPGEVEALVRARDEMRLRRDSESG